MIMDAKNKILNEEGQAFFEMIVFVPFMLYLFSLIITFGNSVNGSINQNKILRGAYYHLLNHNSMAPRKDFLESLQDAGVGNVGMFVLGYQEAKQEDLAIAACYRVNKVFGGTVDEQCSDPPPAGEEGTNQIRLYTFYGLCTASFSANGGGFQYQDFMTNSLDACLNRN